MGLAAENLTSPPVLAFALGALAVVLRSDLRLPDPIHTWLATYLLLAIGTKGGHALQDVDLMTIMVPDLLEATEEIRGLCVHVVDSLHDVRGFLSERA